MAARKRYLIRTMYQSKITNTLHEYGSEVWFAGKDGFRFNDYYEAINMPEDGYKRFDPAMIREHGYRTRSEAQKNLKWMKDSAKKESQNIYWHVRCDLVEIS